MDKLLGNNVYIYESVVNISEGTVYSLQEEDDHGNIGIVYGSGVSQDYARVLKYSGTAFAKVDLMDLYLVNIRNGERKVIKKGIKSGGAYPSFSSGGRFLIWYDANEKAYFSFDIKSGVTKNISFAVPMPLFNEIYFNELSTSLLNQPVRSSYGNFCWLKDDEAVLIYDRYDIWQLDPDGIKQPVNVTNGYGRKNRIILRGMNHWEVPVYTTIPMLIKTKN